MRVLVPNVMSDQVRRDPEQPRSSGLARRAERGALLESGQEGLGGDFLAGRDADPSLRVAADQVEMPLEDDLEQLRVPDRGPISSPSVCSRTAAGYRCEVDPSITGKAPEDSIGSRTPVTSPRGRSLDSTHGDVGAAEKAI